MQKIIKTDLGYIAKIENPEELINPLDKLGSHFGGLAHFGYPFNLETIKTFYSNPIRFKECFIYFYFDQNDEPKSGIWWMKQYEPRINKKILLEYMWVSSDPKYSIAVLNESIKHVNTLYKYDTIVMGNIENNEKLDKFYLNKKFKLDSKSFYKNI